MDPTPAQPGSASIKAEFDEGQLTLCCEGEAFDRLRDLLAAEGGGLEALEVTPGEVVWVLVVHAGQCRPPGRLTWAETATTYSCLAVLAAMVIVFFIGLGTVIGWITE